MGPVVVGRDAGDGRGAPGVVGVGQADERRRVRGVLTEPILEPGRLGLVVAVERVHVGGGRRGPGGSGGRAGGDRAPGARDDGRERGQKDRAHHDDRAHDDGDQHDGTAPGRRDRVLRHGVLSRLVLVSPLAWLCCHLVPNPLCPSRARSSVSPCERCSPRAPPSDSDARGGRSRTCPPIIPHAPPGPSNAPFWQGEPTRAAHRRRTRQARRRDPRATGTRARYGCWCHPGRCHRATWHRRPSS